MKRVAFVLPYYGRFPSYFQLFLDSCGGNPDFDWLVFTDDHYPYDYPGNVHVHYETFEDMRRRVMGRIDAPVSLDSPYKLCDFKPAYGLVFSEYLEEYDWWGYCDCDVVFGRLGRFISDDMLDSYDKLFLLGHCSLYRNDDAVNRAFMLPLNVRLIVGGVVVALAVGLSAVANALAQKHMRWAIGVKACLGIFQMPNRIVLRAFYGEWTV